MLFNKVRKQNRRGQGLVEYIFIVAAVAFIALAALSLFGHKVADQYAIGAGMLPGAHTEDNAPVATGEFAGLTEDADGNLVGDGTVGWADINGGTAQGDGNAVGAPGGTPATGDVFVAGDED